MPGLQMKYFVLKPAGIGLYSTASRVAMIAYADAIKEENPELAKDLEQWVKREFKNMQLLSTKED